MEFKPLINGWLTAQYQWPNQAPTSYVTIISTSRTRLNNPVYHNKKSRVASTTLHSLHVQQQTLWLATS